jgi:hypothetical protein
MSSSTSDSIRSSQHLHHAWKQLWNMLSERPFNTAITLSDVFKWLEIRPIHRNVQFQEHSNATWGQIIRGYLVTRIYFWQEHLYRSALWKVALSSCKIQLFSQRFGSFRLMFCSKHSRTLRHNAYRYAVWKNMQHGFGLWFCIRIPFDLKGFRRRLSLFFPGSFWQTTSHQVTFSH